MAQQQDGAPRASAVVEKLVKQLNTAYKAVKLYPPTSSIPRDSAAAVVGTLHVIFQREPTLRILVGKEGLSTEEGLIYPGHAAFTEFAREFYNRNLSEVRFHAGVSENEVVGFLQVLAVPPGELASSGGFEVRLWDLQVDDVTVKETSTRIVDHGVGIVPDRPAGEEWPPKALRIDEIIAGAIGRRPRDQRLLVRVMEDQQVLSEYFQGLGRGEKPTVNMLMQKISAMVRVAMTQLPEDQARLHRTLAETIMQLDPEMRRALLGEKILPLARKDEAVASLVRQMDLLEVCRALVEGVEPTEESKAGLSRALHNLALVSHAGRDDVFATAAQVMESPLGAEFAESVLAAASPSKLVVRSRKRHEEEKPIERILQLLDLAPMEHGHSGAPDEEVALLRREAVEGISDGDVIGSLVTLATIEGRDEEFASVMSVVEDSLGLLVERQDFDVAAQAAALLVDAERDPARSEQQRNRLVQAIRTLSEPRHLKVVTDALRVYRHDTPENQACRRLLAVLGPHSISPMLEVLANEEDMTSRKAIVDLLSPIASTHLQEFGERMADPRWYFLRNIVSILSATKSRDILPYLERTLRHPDARVRRETIRALSGIDDRLADEMLIGALDDDDPQNVSLAARYLGGTKMKRAVPYLCAVATGEGRGSRDVAPRIEAIEALGRIGSRDALPTLKTLARQRALPGRGGRIREMRTAAEAAIAAIEQKGAGS